MRNLLSACASIQAALHALASETDAGRDSNHPQTAQLLARIRARAEQVEQVCAQRDSTPAALPTPSRRAYQWLKYLSTPENLLAQIATMVDARRLIAEMQWLKQGELARHTFTFELSYGSYLYHVRPEGARASTLEPAPAAKNIRIRAAQGFSGAPPEILEALIKASLSRRQRKARALVNAYVSGEDFAETSLGFELAAALPEPDVRGRHHDLLESFARVNAAYFEGSLAPPRLTWSRNITRSLMGCYLAERDTLMVSLTLDREDVPAHIVDYIMYHELLHRVLGVPLVHGRRRPHGPAFRDAEQKFADYAGAGAFLRRLAQTSYRPRPRRPAPRRASSR